MAKSDLQLSVSAELINDDRIARQLRREMEDAGREGADRFGGAVTQSLQKQDARIARAFEKTLTPLTRLDELNALLERDIDRVSKATDRFAASQEKVNRLVAEGKEETQQYADAIAELRQNEIDLDAAQRKKIQTEQQRIRTNRDLIQSYRQVKKAQQDVEDEASFESSILTIGKYISALRAISVPIGAVVVGGIIGQVAESAAILTQGLWMIPAAAAGAAAGMGTLSIATMGFSDAIDDIGDPEKFAESLQSLSPNAQQAALAIQALMEPLTELKNATQDAFFEGGADMLNSLANEYLPMVESLTTGVAGGMNDMMRSVFEQLMTPETKEILADAVTDIVEAFRNLAPAAGDFAGALAQIVSTGASFLPEMATALARGAESFNTLISAAAESGDLERWFREGIDAVAGLWEGIQNVAKEFMSMAEEGRTSLPEMVDNISAIAAALPPVLNLLSETLEPINQMSKGFNDARAAIQQYKDAAKAALTIIGGMVDWVVQKIEQLSSRISKFLGPLGRFIPGLGPLSDAGAFSAAGGGGSFGGMVVPKNQMGAAGTIGQIPEGSYRRRDGTLGSTRGNRLGGTPGGTERPIDSGTAGLPGVPAGGYPVPAPPPEKKGGGGGGGSADEPPFYADPELWSVDANPVMPVDALPPGLASPSGLQPNAANLNNIVSSLFPMLPSAGGWRPPDGYNEHSAGEAVDFMVGENLALGDAINQFILDNAKALGVQYNIWRQAMWYPDGRVTPMEDRGDPTQNHFDHVHTRVFPGDAAAGGIATGMDAGVGAMKVVDPEQVMRKEMALQNAKDALEEKRLRLLELQAKGNASQSQLLSAENNVRQAEDRYRLAQMELAKAREGDYKELERGTKSAAKSTANNLGQIGAALADDFGLSEGLPGVAKWITSFLANLAMAPMIGGLSAISAASPIQGGYGAFGMMGAQNIAAGGTPLGLTAPGVGGFAPVAGGMGVGMTPMAPAPGVGVGPLPGPPPTLMPPGGGPAAAPATAMTSRAPAAGAGGGFQGLGELPMQAINMGIAAGSLAIDAMAPGAGAIAGQAAQTGVQIANRTAAFMGQLGGIAAGGLMETFLPNNSEAGDPAKSWVGRVAAGISGARPAVPNSAGSKPAAPPQQQANQGGGQSGPMVNIENMVNNTPDGGQSVANQVARSAMTGYGAGGPR